MFNLSFRGASLPLLTVGASLSFLLVGCGGGTNLPRPGSGQGGLGDNSAGSTTVGGTTGGTTGGGTVNGNNTATRLGTNGIVFVSTRDGNPEIYSINADGTGARRLTTNSATDEQPARSADGRFIVFSSRRDGNPEIYIMNADGTDQRRLTNDGAIAQDAPDDVSPVLSPDGTKIVWQSTRAITADGGAVRRLYTMDASGANQRPVIFDDANQPSFGGSWNPDSTRLLSYLVNTNDSNFNDLALITPATTATGAATSASLRPGTSAADARYSPNGQRIVQFNAPTLGQARLQLLDSSGNLIGDGPSGGVNQLGPSFSPNSNRLVWDANTVAGAGRQLYVANVAASGAQGAGTAITTDAQGENYDASWTQ